MTGAERASGFPWPTDGLSYGGDYNPEQWSWEVIQEDMELMRRAGITLVTLGVFSWVVHEPRDGEFDFTWLDRMLDLLHENGIAVDLATPTAAPPMWLQAAHPEILPEDEWSRRRAPGGRLGWCASSPVFRNYATRVVERLAEHVAGHPAVRLWHVSNELGGGNGRCHCADSTRRFQEWVAGRYGTIGAVNDAWGMAFWGNDYSAFDEIQTPRGGTNHNPSQLLDYERFSSDELLDHYRAERAILKRWTPDIPVTTNFMVGLGPDVVDYARWAPEMDVVGNDHYTYGPDPRRHQELAFSGDRMRGISNGGPWMLMEHATGASSWHAINQPKLPGEMIRHAIGHVARGSDSVMFFQWRASRAGIEQFHSAMLPHAGAETRVFEDVVRLGGIVHRLREVRGTRVADVRVALLHDNEAGWALRSGLKPNNRIEYADTARAIHGALFDRAVTADVIPPWADLDPYACVIVPGLFLVTDEHAAAIAAYAAAGGTVLVTWFSGIVDDSNTVRLGGYPGAFRELVGASSEQLHPLTDDESVELDQGWRARRWTELMRVGDAEVVAAYSTGPYSGHPAITRRPVGRGAVWYLSTELETSGLDALLARILDEAGVRATAATSAGVEAVRRRDGDRSYLFLINHSDTDGWAEASGEDILTGTVFVDVVDVAAGAVVVIREGRI